MLVDALRLGTFGLFSAMGGWVLYTDLRFQKIRNRVLLWGAAFAGAAYGLALAATLSATVGVPLLGGVYFNWSFYQALLFHVLLAGAAALALWNLKIWPAGDAKLFALFSLLLPLAASDLPTFPGWLFMTCLINIFLPPAFYIVARALVWALRGAASIFDPDWRAATFAKAVWKLRACRRHPAYPRRLGARLALHQLYYVSYYLVIFALRRQLPASAAWMGPLVGVALMLTVGRLQNRLQRGPYVFLPAFLLGAAWMVWMYGWTAALAAVGRGLQFALTVGLAAELAYWYLSRRETRDVPVDQLQPFQVLAEETLTLFRRDVVFLGENFNLTYKDGILPRQVEDVKAWLKRRGIESAVVYNTAPFAPWIVLGFALTLLLRSDIAWMMRPR